MNITIRSATYADAELIADLSRQTFYDAFAAQNTKENMDKFLNEQFTKEALMKEVYDEGNIFLLAEEAYEPVGYARMRESKMPPELDHLPAIEIARIYSIKSKIGKGVGSSLMHRCIQIAKEKQKQIIWLGVWEHNFGAIEFYKKWGFEKFGTHPFLLGNDLQTDWLMKKNIDLT